jgi:predicted enzyme related to lactoylglutathione lyase
MAETREAPAGAALKPGTPSWVDFSTNDVEKAKTFYGGVFGWKFRDLGPDAGGYFMVDNADGKEVAGGGPLQDPNMPPAWTSYVKVVDAAATVAKAEAAGGRVLVAPMDVMGAGTMAILMDPTGAVIALWQDGAHQGAEVYNGVGSLCWNELGTRDVEAAKKFYGDVFGWVAKTEGEAGQEYTQFFLDDRSIAGMMDVSKVLPPEVPAYWLPYFGTASTQAVVDKVPGLGGQVRMGPMPSPFGDFAVIADPAGAVFAVIQLQQP